MIATRGSGAADIPAPLIGVNLPPGVHHLPVDARLFPGGQPGTGLQRGFRPVQSGPGPVQGIPRPVDGVQAAVNMLVNGQPRLPFAASDPLFAGVELRLPVVRTRLPQLGDLVAIVRDPIPLISRPIPLVRDPGALIGRTVPASPVAHLVAVGLPHTSTLRRSEILSTWEHPRTPRQHRRTHGPHPIHPLDFRILLAQMCDGSVEQLGPAQALYPRAVALVLRYDPDL
jgi:hypothetical protein